MDKSRAESSAKAQDVEYPQQTQESFRTFIENSLTGIYIIQSGKFQFVNSRMAEILGYDQSHDLIGKDFLEIVHPDDREIVGSREFQRETTPVTPSHYCYRGMKTDGTLVWFEMSGTTASYRGKPANIGHIIDITSRKNAEDKWQESEQKYLSLLDDIEEGYFENDLQGILNFVNDSYCLIFGYEKQELIGTSFRRLVSDGASADEIYEDYNQMYTTGEPLKGKAYSFLTKDGLVKHIEIRSSLNISSKGKPIGFRGIVRDVTDKTLATQALQESEKKYRTILETIEDGYIEVDITGTTTFCNEKTCQIFGYPREEFMGLNNRQYMDEGAARHVYKAFNKVYRTGNPERGVVYEIIRKDQNKRIVEINVSLRKNKTGDVEGFNGIVRDITDRGTAIQK